VPRTEAALTAGVRLFYEELRAKMQAELPGAEWPTFDELTFEQMTAWILAVASACAATAHLSLALVSVGMPQDLT
jgi:hypothetical protein